MDAIRDSLIKENPTLSNQARLEKCFSLPSVLICKHHECGYVRHLIALLLLFVMEIGMTTVPDLYLGAWMGTTRTVRALGWDRPYDRESIIPYIYIDMLIIIYIYICKFLGT